MDQVKFEATVSMGKLTGEKVVRISIRDAANYNPLLETTISLEELAQALTGLAERPAEGVLYPANLERVNKKRECCTHEIHVTALAGLGTEEWEKEASRVVKKTALYKTLKKQGWEWDPYSTFRTQNGWHSVSGARNEYKLNLRFVRYV
jgi:hypothetical protein